MKLASLRKLPKDKLQKLILIGVLTLILVVSAIQFYVLQNWNTLSTTQEQIAKLDDQIQKAERRQRSAKQDLAYRAQVKQFVTTQKAAMIAGDPFAWVVREVSLQFEQHPVRMTGLHPGTKEETPGSPQIASYTTRIEFSGTYDQIGTFVRDLENRFPTAEIQSVSVSGNADDKGQHGAALDIALRFEPVEAAAKSKARKAS